MYVLDAEQDAPVALDLLQMAALVAQQALVVLVAGQDVDDAPEAGPATEPAGFHVSGNQAGGGADGHQKLMIVFAPPDRSYITGLVAEFVL